MQSGPADAFAGQVGVGYLKAHPDRQRQVREVQVVGRLAAEVDPALRRAVVQPRLSKDQHAVDGDPCQSHARDRQAAQEPTRGRVGPTSLNERERHRNELAPPAARRTPSAAAREASSARAIRAVAIASAVATLTPTQTTKTRAAMSEAHSTATAHDAPFARTNAAATAPATTPTVTRVPARPE